jgi:hypothetical protein
MPPSPSPRLSPLELHDEFVRIVRDAAAPLIPSVRARFYEVDPTAARRTGAVRKHSPNFCSRRRSTQVTAADAGAAIAHHRP